MDKQDKTCATCRYYKEQITNKRHGMIATGKCSRENVTMTPISWCEKGWRKK